MSINKTSVRSVLIPLAYIEPHSWSAFHLDAYEHTRSFFLEPKSYLKPLKIKMNAVKLLEKKLANEPGILKDIVCIGSDGEPYGEVESHYRLTRGVLKTLYKYHYPIHLISSSFELLEDIELLKKIAEEDLLHITVPIVLKHHLYHRFYPNEETDQTLSLIKTLRLAMPKVHISALVLPILPCVGDDDSSIEMMMIALKKVGVHMASFSLYKPMNIKQTQIFLDTMQDFPELLELFVKRFNLVVEDGHLVEGVAEVSAKDIKRFRAKVDSLLTKYQLNVPVPRYIPKDFRHSNYILAQRLFHRAYLCELQGEENESIKEIAYTIQSMKYTVSKQELLELAKNDKVKRDIDYFLHNDELKTFGQARLF